MLINISKVILNAYTQRYFMDVPEFNNSSITVYLSFFEFSTIINNAALIKLCMKTFGHIAD